ncbi:MAG: PKD domain-containing protein, partial [Candidatus Eiseniibacteriota bacterium]
EPVSLPAAGHYSDNQALTYSWTQVSGPPVPLSDPSAAAPTFTTPEGLANTDLVFELSVSDGTSTSADTVTITVNANDDAPVADAGQDQQALPGDLVAVAGQAQDIDSGSLTFTWVQTGGPAIEIADPHDPTLLFEAPPVLGTVVLRFELRVSDGTNTSVDTIQVVVNGPTSAPASTNPSPGAAEPRSRFVESAEDRAGTPDPVDPSPPEVEGETESDGSEDLAQIAPGDLALLDPEVSGAQFGFPDDVARGLAGTDPSVAMATGSRLFGLDALVPERLELRPPATPPADNALFQSAPAEAARFEDYFVPDTTPETDSGLDARPSTVTESGTEAGAVPPRGANVPLLAGLYGILRAAAGVFAPPQPPANPPDDEESAGKATRR